MTSEGGRRIHFWYLVIFSIESSTTFLRIYCESGRVRAEAQTCGHCWKFGRGQTGPGEPRRDPRWNGTDQVGAGIVRSCRSPSVRRGRQMACSSPVQGVEDPRTELDVGFYRVNEGESLDPFSRKPIFFYHNQPLA